MTTGIHTYEFAVSEMLFRLVTECVHLHSNDLRRLVTLGEVVDERAARAADGFPGQESDSLRGHLATALTGGEIRLGLQVSTETEALLAAGQARLAERLGSPVSLDELVSLLLFDFSVDRAAALMLAGLLGEETRTLGIGKSPPPASGPGGKVVPIR